MANAKTDDVRNIANTVVEQLRTPLLAALGAGNLAAEAVSDYVGKARERVTESGEAARKSVEDLPSDVSSLRDRLDPAELRKLIDEYTEAALKLYNRLAETGEQTLDKFLAEPRVKSVIDQLEEVTNEARGRIEDALGLAAKKTREGGASVAVKSSEVASDLDDAADSVATETAKPATKPSAAAKPATTRRTTTAAKKPAGDTTAKNDK